MREQIMAEENVLFKILAGSHLYGTNIDGSSDRDYLGVFVPDEDYVMGIKRCEQVEFKTNPSSSSRANCKTDIDSTIYALPKYIHLAAENNPTILETLFPPDNCIVQDTELGKLLRNNYHLFVSKKAKHTFLGYSFSQKQKVLNKKDRWSQFLAALEQVEKYEKQGLEHLPERLSLNTDLIENGYWKIYEKGTPIYLTKENIIKEIERYGDRLENIKKWGYDPKFLSHVVRLIDEGIEILVEGRIQLPLSNVSFIKDVKAGKYELPYVLKYVDDKEKIIEEAYVRSQLPNRADLEAINKLQIRILEEFWDGRKI